MSLRIVSGPVASRWKPESQQLTTWMPTQPLSARSCPGLSALIPIKGSLRSLKNRDTQASATVIIESEALYPVVIHIELHCAHRAAVAPSESPSEPTGSPLSELTAKSKVLSITRLAPLLL